MESVKRVVVADTGAEFRRSLVRTLNDEPGLRVVGETGEIGRASCRERV